MKFTEALNLLFVAVVFGVVVSATPNPDKEATAEHEGLIGDITGLGFLPFN